MRGRGFGGRGLEGLLDDGYELCFGLRLAHRARADEDDARPVAPGSREDPLAQRLPDGAKYDCANRREGAEGRHRGDDQDDTVEQEVLGSEQRAAFRDRAG